MKTSNKIKMRLRDNKKRFFANDNIADFMEAGEIDELQAEVTVAMEKVLSALVIDTENDHNTRDTAKRVAKMFIKETFNGRYTEAPAITAFPNMGYKGLYVSGPISIRSTCAHHFQNIVGKCWVGVIPEKEVIGLSKFNRIINHIAERPQIQEEMTTEIANALKELAKTDNIAVIIKAEHHCLTHRGVKEHESDMATSVMLGQFMEDATLRNEFYQVIATMKGHNGN